DNALYVSNLSFGAPPGAGQVVRIQLPSKPVKGQVHTTSTSAAALPVNVAADTVRQSAITTEQPSGFVGPPNVIETLTSDSVLQEDAAKRLSKHSELGSVSVSITEGR